MDDILVLTWRISNLMAIASVIILIYLIVFRVFSAAGEKKREKKKKQIRTLIYQSMENPKKLQKLVEKFADADRIIASAAIIQLLDSVRGETRDNLLNVLRAVRAEKYYIEQLRSGSVHLKIEAARRLALFNTDKVKNALLEAFGDKHIDVRVRAAESLWELGVRVRLSNLLGAFYDGEIDNERAVDLFFKEIASEYGKEIITELNTHSLSKRARISLITALGHSNNFEAIPSLYKIMQTSESVNERASAMRSVGLLGHPMGASAVRLGLNDDHWEVVTQAAIAAGRIKDVSAITKLVTLLESKNWWLRFRSAEALKALGAKGIAALKKRAAHNAEAADICSILEAQG